MALNDGQDILEGQDFTLVPPGCPETTVVRKFEILNGLSRLPSSLCSPAIFPCPGCPGWPSEADDASRAEGAAAKIAALLLGKRFLVRKILNPIVLSHFTSQHVVKVIIRVIRL